MMNRRSFFSLLAGLPLVNRFARPSVKQVVISTDPIPGLYAGWGWDSNTPPILLNTSTPIPTKSYAYTIYLRDDPQWDTYTRTDVLLPTTLKETDDAAD